MSLISRQFNNLLDRVVDWHLARKKERQSQLDSKKEEINKRINEEKQTIRDAEAGLERQLIAEYLLIDSNIWMDGDYDKFFNFLLCLLKKKEIILEMPNIQFDEIVNLKNRMPFHDPKNKRARLAINRLENFQKEKRLKIVPLQLQAAKGAYADPELLKILLHLGKERESLIFISNDKELRIRARQLVEMECKTQFVALGDSDIQAPFFAISSARRKICEAEKDAKKLQEELANC